MPQGLRLGQIRPLFFLFLRVLRRCACRPSAHADCQASASAVFLICACVLWLIWRLFGPCRPILTASDQGLSSLAELWLTNPGLLAQIWNGLGPISPTDRQTRQHWPTLFKSAPGLSNNGHYLDEIDPTRANIGRCWSHVGRTCLKHDPTRLAESQHPEQLSWTQLRQLPDNFGARRDRRGPLSGSRSVQLSGDVRVTLLSRSRCHNRYLQGRRHLFFPHEATSRYSAVRLAACDV